MGSPEIVFSEQAQLALLGHLIADPKIYAAAQLLSVDDKFFTRPNPGRIFRAIQSFEATYHRHPSLAELKSGPLAREEAKVVESVLRTIDQALAARKEVGFDSIVEDLKTTRVATVLRQRVELAVAAWNKMDIKAARQELEECVTDLARVDHQGVTASTYDAETWSARELQDRVDMRGKIVYTGVRFLDEAMDGVAPDDLVLVASKTGVGKSQLLAQIALNATAAGKKVFLLALEASPGEMQRRLKFPSLMRHYRANLDSTQPEEDIDFVKYCHGEYTELLAPYEKLAHEEFVRKYSSLQTLYKHSANYTEADMERDIVRMAPHVDLILVDHLHYVDASGNDNENVAAKKLIKKLREVGQSMRKPIIAAAHMRKTDGPRKFAPLLPGVEDVMGSSDLVKVATHVIVLGPTMGVDQEQLDLSALPNGLEGVPTFVRMVKSRTAGVDRTQYTALCFFQQREGRYATPYCLGRLRQADTHWQPVYEGEKPRWADSCVGWKPPTNQA